MISLIPALTYAVAQEACADHVVDHILHVANKIGFDHIGIGSDFDGMEKGVEGVEDCSKFPDLIARLLARGISHDDVVKITGGNIIRVMGEVEDVAALREDEACLEDEVAQLWNADFRQWVEGKFPSAEKHRRNHTSK